MAGVDQCERCSSPEAYSLTELRIMLSWQGRVVLRIRQLSRNSETKAILKKEMLYLKFSNK